MTKKLGQRNDPVQHNYMKKIAALKQAGKIPDGPGVYHVNVMHDSWCNIYRGGYCDCDPDIVIQDTGSEAES